MDETLHARMPGRGEWDGSEWTYVAVCGRVVTPLGLVLAGRRPNCPECLADLGLSPQTIIPLGAHDLY